MISNSTIDKIELIQVTKEDLSIIQKFNLFGSCDPLEVFPIIEFHNSNADEKPEFHPFYIKIKKIMEDNTLDERSCDFIFSKFLYSASRLVNKEGYLVLSVFFRKFRECLNNYGYSTIENYLKDKDCKNTKMIMLNSDVKNQMDKKSFCVDCSVEYIPLLADKFILEYLPEKCSEFNQELARDLMLDFCNWLVKKKLTKIKINRKIK